MSKNLGGFAIFPYLPWCCLGSLLAISLSSLVILQPMANAASILIVIIWGLLFAECFKAFGTKQISRSLRLSMAACVMATALHVVMLQVTGQDCVVFQSLDYLYWQVVISPDAPLYCSWCVG